MTAGQDSTAISAVSFEHLDTPFTRWLVRWRFVFFALVAVMIVLPFNGQWRMGLDSALYRGVADNLVAGKGYTFAGLRQTQVYPGLPFILAGVQWIAGSKAVWPVLIGMNLAALLTLVGVYHLVRGRFAEWIAVVVTCGVAMNVKFVQQSHEVMTDMPFLLGVVAALLGWEWMGRKQEMRGRVCGVLLFSGGLLLAAVMRPTFWVVALALVLTCVWNLIRYREKRSLLALVLLCMVGISFALFDPRVRGWNILQGGYEREFLALTQNLLGQVQRNASSLFQREITESFYGETLSIFGLPVALLLLGGALMVLWRRPLWGLQVFILCGIMLTLSDAPRYLLMVLPTMWVGYVMVLLWLTQKLKNVYRDWCLFVMFSLANFINLSGYCKLMYEQHHGDFRQVYREGSFVKLEAMAEVIRRQVPPDAVIVGPHGNLLAYLSDRNVRNARLLGLEAGAISKYPTLVARHHPTYMIGPANVMRAKDPAIARLVEHGVIRPLKLVEVINDPTGTLWLATCEVVVPTGDFRKLPKSPVVVYADKPAKRPALTPEELANRELKAKRLRKEIRAKRERKAIRAAREEARRQTTQPSTAPATEPAAPSTTEPANGGAGISPRSMFHVPLEQLGMGFGYPDHVCRG